MCIWCTDSMEHNSYRRPDREWKCGAGASGHGCPLGPDYRGRCGASKTNQCHPKRTLKWWRGYLPVAFASITIMIIVVGWSTQSYREWIAPGPLSLAHAQLLANPQDPHRCAACHDDSFEKKSDQVTSNSDSLLQQHSQTARCTVCHAKELPGLVNNTPHDLEKPNIERLTQLVSTTRINSEKPFVLKWLSAAGVNGPIDWQQHQLACSDCHVEHQGANHDLKMISSGRCQACHQEQFQSFSKGHPEFTDYPKSAPSEIAFDHARHRDLHFGKSSTTFDCKTCHVDSTQKGRVGQVFRSLSFDAACASCHKAPLSSSLQDGIVLFQVPSLNANAMSQEGSQLQDWPQAASQYQEGKIPPLMLLMLAADSKNRDWIAKLPKDGKIEGLDIKNPNDRQVLTELANATRQLLYQIAQGGQTEVIRRLDNSTQFAIHQTESIATPDSISSSGKPIFASTNSTFHRDLSMSNLPPDLARTAYQNWFGPDQSNATSGKSTWRPLKGAVHLPMGGWMIDQSRLALVYFPSGHADDWLARILERVAFNVEFHTQSDLGSGPVDGTQQTLNFAMQMMFKEGGASRCNECHLVLNKRIEKEQSDLVRHAPVPVRWRSAQYDPSIRNLTKFDHGPHLILPMMQDCRVCHRLPESVDKQPSIGLIQFESVKKADCSSCHRAEAAGESCTQCHNYHTNKSILSRLERLY